MKTEENEDLPFLFQLIGFVLMLALAVVFIVFTILTLGIFLPDEEEKQKQSVKKVSSPEEQLRINLQRKKNRAAEVAKRIYELEPMTQKIKKTERRVLFTSRLIVAGMLVGANLYFIDYNRLLGSTPAEEFYKCFMKKEFIGDIVNFNGLILIAYGLPAYILYGTSGRLTATMKDKIIRILRKKHIHTFTELLKLREEEKLLKQEISHLNTLLLEYS